MTQAYHNAAKSQIIENDQRNLGGEPNNLRPSGFISTIVGSQEISQGNLPSVGMIAEN